MQAWAEDNRLAKGLVGDRVPIAELVGDLTQEISGDR